MLLLTNQSAVAPTVLFGANGEPLKAIVSADRIIAEFGCGVATNRAEALRCLTANFGRAVPRDVLLTAVYGSDAKTNIGALGMVLDGLRVLIKKRNLPFRVLKANATITLAPVGETFAVH